MEELLIKCAGRLDSDNFERFAVDIRSVSSPLVAQETVIYWYPSWYQRPKALVQRELTDGTKKLVKEVVRKAYEVNSVIQEKNRCFYPKLFMLSVICTAFLKIVFFLIEACKS